MFWFLNLFNKLIKFKCVQQTSYIYCLFWACFIYCIFIVDICLLYYFNIFKNHQFLIVESNWLLYEVQKQTAKGVLWKSWKSCSLEIYLNLLGNASESVHFKLVSLLKKVNGYFSTSFSRQRWVDIFFTCLIFLQFFRILINLNLPQLVCIITLNM